MKLVAISLGLCGMAFCQDAPPNAVNVDALKKRIESMKLLDGFTGLRTQPQVLVLNQRPSVCAIPLRNALRPDDRVDYKIRVVKPKAVEGKGAVVAGLPACK